VSADPGGVGGASGIRLVLDTNVILRGLLNLRSAAGTIIEAVERRSVVLLLSKPVVAEYRAVLTDPIVVDRFADLSPERVEVALRRFRYLGDYLRTVRTRFALPRDPRDEMFIELAIAGEATHIVTADEDLLALAGGRGESARRLRQRLPKVRVLDPAGFVGAHGARIGRK
jgi:putative PIN family toxin of toxin-antitoxin system